MLNYYPACQIFTGLVMLIRHPKSRVRRILCYEKLKCMDQEGVSLGLCSQRTLRRNRRLLNGIAFLQFEWGYPAPWKLSRPTEQLKGIEEDQLPLLCSDLPLDTCRTHLREFSHKKSRENLKYCKGRKRLCALALVEPLNQILSNDLGLQRTPRIMSLLVSYWTNIIEVTALE